MDWDFLFNSILIPGLSGFIVSFIITFFDRKYSKRRIIYCNDEGWLPIETLKNRKEWRHDFLITDGYTTKREFRHSYDKYGKIYFSIYTNTYATHWRELPMPPMKKGSESNEK